MTKLVSIIVPIYNAEKFIDQCLNTIVDQSYQNIEIILVNDGSTDQSIDKCIAWEQADSRIRVIDQVNGGVSIARNKGIDVATGELLLFIDVDDYIEQETVKTLVEQQSQTQADMVIYGFYRHLMDGTIRKNEGNQTTKMMSSSQFLSQFWQHYEEEITNTPFNKLYKSQILKENHIYFPEGITMGEDLLFNLDYLAFTKQILISDSYLYHYMMHPNQATLKVNIAIYEDYIHFFEKIESIILTKISADDFDWKHHYHQLLKHMITAIEMPYRSDSLDSKEQKEQLFKIIQAFQNNFELENLISEDKLENIIRKLIQNQKYYQLHVYLKTIQDSKKVAKNLLSMTRGG